MKNLSRAFLVVLFLCAGGFAMGATSSPSSTKRAAVSQVSVNIDGVSYTCSQGGGGSGNLCECVVVPPGFAGGQYYYEVFKQGAQQDGTGYYVDAASAQQGCQSAIVTMPNCYSN